MLVIERSTSFMMRRQTTHISTRVSDMAGKLD
jgi:hypothetical protein